MEKLHTHLHHIIPVHAGGTDDESNLVRLTIPAHAEAHRLLFEEHGRLEDKIAWKMLSGRTEEGEVLRKQLAQEKLREVMKDPVRVAEWKRKISTTLTGRTQSQETKIKRGLSVKLAYVADPTLRERKSVASKANAALYREAMRNGLSAKMAEGRKTSEKWRNSVTNTEYKNKKSLMDPRRRAVVVDGVTYHGLREASRRTGIIYSRLQKSLRDGADLDFVRFA